MTHVLFLLHSQIEKKSMGQTLNSRVRVKFFLPNEVESHFTDNSQIKISYLFKCHSFVFAGICNMRRYIQSL